MKAKLLLIKHEVLCPRSYCRLYMICVYCRQSIHVVRVRCHRGRRPQLLSRGPGNGSQTT